MKAGTRVARYFPQLVAKVAVFEKVMAKYTKSFFSNIGL